MIFDYRAFWLAKDPRQADDYQDAYAVDPARGLAAIADGVSASLFAGRWADVLVRAAVDQPPSVADPAAVGAWLATCREQWSRPIEPDALPWHQRLKLADGAAATLLWVQLAADDPANTAGDRTYRLSAHAIGDSCLLHVAGDRIAGRFHWPRAASLAPRPRRSRRADRREALPSFESVSLVCRAGDFVLLATDAVAAWLLGRSEQDDLPDWEACWNMPEPDWRQWIARLRDEQQMRYDDATLVMLRLREMPTAQRGRAAADN